MIGAQTLDIIGRIVVVAAADAFDQVAHVVEAQQKRTVEDQLPRHFGRVMAFYGCDSRKSVIAARAAGSAREGRVTDIVDIDARDVLRCGGHAPGLGLVEDIR